MYFRTDCKIQCYKKTNNQSMQCLCYCFLRQWTTDIDFITMFIADNHATKNHKHSAFITQTTNVGVKCMTLHIYVRHKICYSCTVRLIDKSKSIFVHCALALFHRMSNKMGRNTKNNITAPKRVPRKTQETVKATKNQNIEDINLNCDKSDSDDDILSSTTLNMQNTKSTRRRRQNTSIISVDEQLQISIHEISSSVHEAPPSKKAKQAAKIPRQRAPRQRKLRAEDQRTLEILTEKFRSDKNGMKCQIPDCTSNALKCPKPSNLKRHINDMHPKDFKLLFPYEVNKKIQIELEAFNLAQDAIELVTVNGYPFSMLNSSGMQGFIKPRLSTIRSDGHALSIDRKNIVAQVAEQSSLIKNYIARELKGKTLSFMFDVCTISTLSMLGVNVTFMKDAEVVCRSLGTIQIGRRHTSVNLADMLYDILSEFGLTLFNVFTLTTDTAKNAVATSKILNLVASENATHDTVADSSFDMDADDDELYFGIDIENEAELQNVMNNIAAHTQLVTEMTQNIVAKNTSIELINQVNCGTHVFQLSVNDSLKESDSLNTIEKVHNMCVLMRTQIVMIELRNSGCKVILPPLENDTRWQGKFMMVRWYFDNCFNDE